MKILHFVTLFVLLFVFGCSDVGKGKGNIDVCEECGSDKDCKEGLTCEFYSGKEVLGTFCSDGRKYCEIKKYLW